MPNTNRTTGRAELPEWAEFSRRSAVATLSAGLVIRAKFIANPRLSVVEGVGDVRGVGHYL
jgi:hypothetical protein